MKSIIVTAMIGCLVWTSGCGVQRQPAPPRTQFLLDIAVATADDVPQLPSCLQLRSVSARSPFAGVALVYRLSAVAFERDAYNQFLTAPDQQLDAALDKWLRAAGGLPCSDKQAGGDLRLTLEPHLEGLYADFQDPGKPFVAAKIRLVLTQFDRSCRCGRILMDQRVETTAPLSPNPAADAVVEAMSAAVKDALLQGLVYVQQAM